jgi:hypothetical protein
MFPELSGMFWKKRSSELLSPITVIGISVHATVPLIKKAFS